MGKASKAKAEFSEVKELVELIQVLKDVADMKYHGLVAGKDHFQRFGESFAEFFRLVRHSQVRHPLVWNNNPTTAILMISTDESFTGELNNKLFNRVLKEREKLGECEVIVVGKKGAGKLEGARIDTMKSFEDNDDYSLYELSVLVKDFLVEEVMKGNLGTVHVIYPWPKDFNTIRTRKAQLLPCNNMIEEHSRLGGEYASVIEESDPMDIIGYLADIWLSSKLYEIFYDAGMAAAAAQAQQLDSSLDKMKKESATSKLKYRKAKKTDIDSALRETFTSRMMSTKS